MKVVIYTIDLFPGREYLMPWRTILEVARGMIANGHQVIVMNGCNNYEDMKDYELFGVPIVSFATGWDNLIAKVSLIDIDALFIPFTWRAGLKKIERLKRIECKKVAYLPGGVYDICGSLKLLHECTLAVARPYLMECLVPKRLLGKKLIKAGFNATIALNEYSALAAAKAGLPNSVCIYPGLESFADLTPDESLLIKYNLINRKWMLFTGSPAGIRGSSVLVKAVDRAIENVHLVMLIRNDKGAGMEDLSKQLQSLKHRERITVIKEKLSREQLRAFMGYAWYGVLPFLTIPSEIPLTYFELLCCGTPVVSFPNGGTTDYLKTSLAISDRGVNGLAKTLDIVWLDEKQRQQKSENGLKLMASHPSWEEVASKWEKIVK